MKKEPDDPIEFWTENLKLPDEKLKRGVHETPIDRFITTLQTKNQVELEKQRIEVLKRKKYEQIGAEDLLVPNKVDDFLYQKLVNQKKLYYGRFGDALHPDKEEMKKESERH